MVYDDSEVLYAEIKRDGELEASSLLEDSEALLVCQ
jgi:hypothetical protein